MPTCYERGSATGTPTLEAFSLRKVESRNAPNRSRGLLVAGDGHRKRLPRPDAPTPALAVARESALVGQRFAWATATIGSSSKRPIFVVPSMIVIDPVSSSRGQAVSAGTPVRAKPVHWRCIHSDTSRSVSS